MNTLKSFKDTLREQVKDSGFREVFEHYSHSYRIGERVRLLRKSVGMTQHQLAEAMGIPQQSISRLERGELENPTLDTLERVASATGKRLVVDFA